MYLERISDRSLQAAHPITLSVDTMARVLRGVAVKENRGFLGGLVGGKPEAVRVFREEDVEYLAPLLVEGLTRAASDQQVGFRVGQTGAPTARQRFALRLRTVNVSDLALANRRVPIRSRRADTITHDPLLSRSRQNGRTVIAIRARQNRRW